MSPNHLLIENQKKSDSQTRKQMTISPISFLYQTPTTFRSQFQQTHISLRYQISQLKSGICMTCKICQSIRDMECNRGFTYRLGSLKEDNSSPSSPSSPSFSLSLNSRWRTWNRVSKSSVLPSCPVLKSVMKSSPVDKRTSIILLFICIFQLGKGRSGGERGREGRDIPISRMKTGADNTRIESNRSHPL